MARLRTLDTADVTGKTVILRLDLNVPIIDGVVQDLTRIERVLPTLRELVHKGAGIVILAHFDRPKGKVVPAMSLSPVAAALSRALGSPVRFEAVDWQSDPKVSVKAGDIVLMENTRFHPGEEANDAAFAKRLGKLGDIYVNDAFSAAHRAHASTEGIAHLLPSFAGRAMQAEIVALKSALDHPERPMVALVGGAKISGKLELLGNLVMRADGLIIGGGMANTFLAAQGKAVGKSLCEHGLADTARAILETAAKAGCKILLPVDAVVAHEFKPDAPSRVVSVDQVAPDEMILDVGPETVRAVEQAFDGAATLVWNGPLGAFETPPFDRATMAAARHAASLVKLGKLVAIAGGGDTVSALALAGVVGDFTYISTAGGAFLEWLEGKDLPGVKILEDDA